ncbi:MAG: glycosyltransferase [Anaerolineae bacterium]|jgi:cellulose synthase/poly-beta-1,6-N-acetylglucosamine synthase-like glycosyltransferase
MLELFHYVLSALYALVTLWITIYGLNGLVLVVLYWWHRRRDPSAPVVPRSELPPVTVQLPLYNERHVAERLIDTVAALDYPRDRLQIQVLDDSTDETTRLVKARAAYYRGRGVDITVHHRRERTGSKAGALAAAMPMARGELIAIFDADFRPHSDFLLRTVPHLVNDPRLGMVQTRWSHLNADYSPMTRVQALALDGHFVVEQTARSRSGLPMHFNGTAGVWRRSCIEAGGGWQSDTLCEDLDLSYRAQIAGWRFRYLPGVEGPSELPPQILAFKRQQSRWAQGSVQTLRKLAGRLLRSSHLSLTGKLMGLVHLSGYLVYPLVIALLLLTLPLLLYPDALGGPLSLLAPVCLGPVLVYITAQWEIYPDWKRRLLHFPLMVLVGTGIAWNNVLGVWQGLRTWGGLMARTPKFQLEGRQGEWIHSQYRLSRDRAVVGEIILAAYAVVTVIVAWVTGNRGAIIFPLLHAMAFGLVAALSLREMSLGPDRRSTSARRALKEWDAPEAGAAGGE